MKLTTTALLLIALIVIPASVIAIDQSVLKMLLIERPPATMLNRCFILERMVIDEHTAISYDELLERAVNAYKGDLPSRTDRYSVLYDIEKNGKVITFTKMFTVRSVGYIEGNHGPLEAVIDIPDAIKDPEMMDMIASFAKELAVEEIESDLEIAEPITRGYTFRYKYIYLVDEKELFTFDINENPY